MSDYKGQYVYLAGPYTHPDPLVREIRFLESCRATAYVINKLRINAFGTMVHSHPLVTRYPMPAEWEFWADYDTAMVGKALEVWVLCIPGYTNSMGVQTEVKLARKLEKPVRWMIPVPGENLYIVTNEEPKEDELYGSIMEGRLLKEKVGDV